MNGVLGTLVCAAVAVVGPLAACSDKPATSAGKGATREAPPKTAAASRVLAEGVCDKARIKVQVIEVARSGADVLSLTFHLINLDTTAAVTVGDVFSDPDAGAQGLAGSQAPSQATSEEGGTIAGVYLLDEVRQKKLFVMRDDRGRVMCTTDLRRIPPGGRVQAWGRFPAPAGDATHVTVQVPGVAAFRHLPISGPTTGPVKEGG